MDLANLQSLKGGVAFLSCSQDQLLRPVYFPGSLCRLWGYVKLSISADGEELFPSYIFKYKHPVLAIEIIPDELSQLCSYAGSRKWSYFITYKSQPALWTYLTSAAFQILPETRKYSSDHTAYVSFSMEDCTVEFFLWLFSVPLKSLFMSDTPTKNRGTKVNVVSSLPAGLRWGRSTVQHRSLQTALLWTAGLL